MLSLWCYIAVNQRLRFWIHLRTNPPIEEDTPLIHRHGAEISIARSGVQVSLRAGYAGKFSRRVSTPTNLCGCAGPHAFIYFYIKFDWSCELCRTLKRCFVRRQKCWLYCARNILFSSTILFSLFALQNHFSENQKYYNSISFFYYYSYWPAVDDAFHKSGCINSGIAAINDINNHVTVFSGACTHLFHLKSTPRVLFLPHRRHRHHHQCAASWYI